MSDDKLEFASFTEFWPFYLSEHLHPTNRTWHFAGITLGIIIAAVLLIAGPWYLSPLGLVPGYLFAWVGHYGYEKNTPASFGYPWFSLLGDLNVYWRTLTGRIDRDYERLSAEIQRFADQTRRRKAARAAMSNKPV
jgi:hypothetical protein